MSFIVEVTRRKADDPELSFNNLEMFHQNCFGGKIVYYTREGMRDHQQFPLQKSLTCWNYCILSK